MNVDKSGVDRSTEAICSFQKSATVHECWKRPKWKCGNVTVTYDLMLMTGCNFINARTSRSVWCKTFQSSYSGLPFTDSDRCLSDGRLWLAATSSNSRVTSRPVPVVQTWCHLLRSLRDERTRKCSEVMWPSDRRMKVFSTTVQNSISFT